MNYQELREAYQEADLDFNTAFIKAVNNVNYNGDYDYYNPEYHEKIRLILCDILEEYAKSKSKTKNGSILRKLASLVSKILPFIKKNNAKG